MGAPAETEPKNSDSAEPRQGISRRDLLKGIAGAGMLAVADRLVPLSVRRVIPGFSDNDFITPAEAVGPDQPADFSLIPPGEENMHPGVPEGHFFTQQAQFEGKPYPMGYIVYNDTQNNIPMWKTYQDLGGRDIFGHAITNRWQTADGKWIQLFANAGILYNPATQRSEYVNALDMMAKAGIKAKDTWYHIPDSIDGVWDSSLPEAKNKRNPEPGTLEANQIDAFFSPRFLPGVPPERIEALKAFFLKDPNWYTTLGLPTGNGVYAEEGTIKSITVRTQRGAVQVRLDPMPGSTLKPWEPFRLSGTQAYRDLVKDLKRTDLIPTEALKAEYNPYGVGGVETENPQQKFNKKLQTLLAYTHQEDGTEYPHALGLKEEEVNGYIAGTWGEDSIKSFKPLKDADGNPRITLVTDGQYGLRTDRPTNANIQQAIERLNKIDPTTMDLLTSYGLRAITNEVAPGDTFTRHPTYGATWTFKSGILQFNNAFDNYSSTYVLGAILTETRGMYLDQYLVDGKNTAPDALDPNRGIDKSLWFKQWLEQHKDSFANDEYNSLIAWADKNIKNYTDAARKVA